MTNIRPLVSVLMTVYNREKYIAEAIESVIDSSYQNWELIIIDDQSKDRSVEIAKSYAILDKRIRILVNEKNLGDYPNRNKAASFANGKYLKYLDADDTIYKYSLNYMVEAMEKYPEAALGISFNTIDDKSPFPQLSQPKESIYAEFLGKSIIGCGPSASIIKTEVFNKLGGFSGKQYIGDHELWFKIALQYPIIKLQPSLIWWRVHEGQQIVDERKNINIKNLRFHKQLEFLNLSKSFFSTLEYKQANKRLRHNYARGILKHLLKGEIKNYYSLFKKSNLSWFELIQGFKGYI